MPEEFKTKPTDHRRHRLPNSPVPPLCLWGHVVVPNGCLCASVWWMKVVAGGVAGLRKNITSGEMRGCHSGGEIKVRAAGGETGPRLRREQTELTEWLNREMREASVNYKQQVGIRRGIRSTMEHGIRRRRRRKKKELTLISIVGGAVTCSC